MKVKGMLKVNGRSVIEEYIYVNVEECTSREEEDRAIQFEVEKWKQQKIEHLIFSSSWIKMDGDVMF